MTRHESGKMSNAEMVDLIIKNPLKQVTTISRNGRVELVNRTGNLITRFDTSAMDSTMGAFMLKWFDMVGTAATNVYKAALNQIKSDPTKRLERDPAAIAYTDEDRLAWVLLERPATPVTLADLPEFDTFLSQTDPESRKSIIMWIGSLMDEESNRRQFLHLYGSGAEGKSTLTEALYRAFSGQTVNITARQLQSNHFGEELEGKRVYIFNDENNSTFFSTGAFKSLTGDDYMDVNVKFQPVRSINLLGKAIVCSNSQIQIEGTIADTSRIISVELTNITKSATWKPDFLNKSLEMVLYCHSIYLEELSRNPELRRELPSVKSNTVAAVDRRIEGFTDVFNECFRMSPDDKVKRAVLNRTMSKLMSGTPAAVVARTIKDYMLREGFQLRRIAGEYYYTGLVQISGMRVGELD